MPRRAPADAEDLCTSKGGDPLAIFRHLWGYPSSASPTFQSYRAACATSKRPEQRELVTLVPTNASRGPSGHDESKRRSETSGERYLHGWRRSADDQGWVPNNRQPRVGLLHFTSTTSRTTTQKHGMIPSQHLN